jgi:hypothetical protein
MVLRFVKTSENPADFFTKPLPRAKFILFRDMIMGGEVLQNHFHTVHITHMQMQSKVAVGKRKPNPYVAIPSDMENEATVEKMERRKAMQAMLDRNPRHNYDADVAEEDKADWMIMERDFQRLPRKPEVQEGYMKVKYLVDSQSKMLVDKGGRETLAHKRYFNLFKLAKDDHTREMYFEFDKYGELAESFANEGEGPYVRLKGHDAMLVTFGENMKEYREFKKPESQTDFQTSHCDDPAVFKGMPIGVAACKTIFVAITERAKTQFHFDLDVQELMGDGTETVKGNREKWVLWRLRLAHKFASQLQMKADEEALERGDWEACARGTMFAMNTKTCWHSGVTTLMGAKRPEFCLVFHFGLAPFAPYLNKKLNTAGGFGQHRWTPEMMKSQLKEREDHSLDMEEALVTMGGKKPSLQSISKLLQNTFQVPHGILVQSDPRWSRTSTTSFWNFTTNDRKAWCHRMGKEQFESWNELASPVKLAGTSNNVNIRMTGVQLVVEHITKYPGQIFAVRAKPKAPLHHPSCRAIEKLFGEKGLECRDLLAAGNPFSLDMDIWGALKSMHCCGQIWRDSFLHWARGEQCFPPRLRLMTISDSSKMWEMIRLRAPELEEYHHRMACLQLACSDASDAWNRYEYLKRESILAARVYQGEVFQPLFFSLLCDKFSLWGTLEKGPRGRLMQELETKSE